MTVTKHHALLQAFAESAQAGGGVHTAREIAYLLGEAHSPALTKRLHDGVKKGHLRRVAKGLFESALTPPDPTLALYKIATKLRQGTLVYISLESQLSHTGDISQVVMDRLTLMTKGRSGEFVTPYGTIEFTHTKKPVDAIVPNLYFDFDVQMLRANTEQAKADLKHCQRNQHMLTQ